MPSKPHTSAIQDNIEKHGDKFYNMSFLHHLTACHLASVNSCTTQQHGFQIAGEPRRVCTVDDGDRTVMIAESSPALTATRPCYILLQTVVVRAGWNKMGAGPGLVIHPFCLCLQSIYFKKLLHFYPLIVVECVSRCVHVCAIVCMWGSENDF